MQNKNVQKSLITKLTTLFAVIALSLGLVVSSSVFADSGKKDLSTLNDTEKKVTLKADDAADKAKVVAELKKVDSLKEITESDIDSVALSADKSKITVKAKADSSKVSGQVDLTRVDPSSDAAKAAAEKWYAKWWVWALVAAVVATIIGVSYYVVKKRQQK
uniref:Antigenic membrane protein n=1 Tax=Candidatus Phytoplasma meliae TaxID=1848402 RepID=A0A3G3BKC3_9MOLU|nr:antigenic membrane protein [Candidatus Phytoplasma meliae]AYP64677.1 antigenic membrane protein [Candidatus Phytoplasma meliae]